MPFPPPVRRPGGAWLGLVCGAIFAVLAGAASAQITRVANTSLTFPQNPQTFGYRTEAAFPGITFSQPVAIVTPPGETDRVFVVEKTGRIQVVTGLNSTPTKQLFLDLSAKVLTDSEEGLLGLAFHPNFAANGYFYVFYTTTATTSAGTGVHDRVARFTALPAPATNAALLATEVPLISQYDEASNHNGGDLHFGPDGYLYVALGDEGGGNDTYNNSQRINKDFFSGLLRIDVDQLPGNLVPNSHPAVHPGTYRVPADNPFVGATSFNGAAVAPASVRTEFWAVGLRNPWRFSFDPPTGRLFAGDVGQGAREEIDLITKGGNYGWNYREGAIAGPRGSPPAGVTFLEPIWDTDHNTSYSITGGVVYRGSRYAQLYGRYIFGDYGYGTLFAMTLPATGPVQVQTLLTENSPVGFGTDPRNGDILIASIGTGAVKRLVYDTTPVGTPLPATLTATGAFTNLATLTPAPGLVAYDPNVSFWSDFAIKRRWFSVPAVTDRITFAADGNWTFPAGTVWAKHFDLELTRGDPATRRRLETRFIVKTAAGVYGVTYRWNAAQTEADLVPEEGATESITINDGGTLRSQVWRYPSRAECLQCHSPAGGLALSFNTAQLNRTQTYGSGPANQLTALANAGYFTAALPDPATLRALAPATDTTASLEYRVRSYLAANCVQCHQPDGAALGAWDARIATPTASAGLVGGLLINPAGDSANRVIAPADPAHSMLLTRISTRGANQMPPIASSELDNADIALVTAWINSLGAPAFTTQPASQSVFAGATVTFTAAVSSGTAVTYQWRRNGVDLAGATSATLTLVNVQAADAATYTVVATNSGGSVTSSSATLTVSVNPAPVFTTQPLSQTVLLGGTATFSVAVTGNPAPTIQWQKNGTAIAGATASTYTITNVRAADAGTYTAVATNSAGTATSAGAVLTPTTTGVPTISAHPRGHVLAVGGTVVFSVEASAPEVAGATGLHATAIPSGPSASAADLAYQWYRNGVPIPGATSSQYLLSNVQAASAGSYTVTVASPSGSVTSNAATLAVISTGDPGRFINVSARIVSGTGDQVLIVGFVTGGAGTSGTKPLLVRGIGPALAAYGVPGVMADPLLEVIPSGSTVPVISNDNWSGNATVAATATAVGAFALTDSASKDAALVANLASGPYSAKVSGVGNTTGTVLAEVYDAAPATFNPATPRLINVSARAAMANDNPLIAGFVIGGTTAKTVLIRAVGPFLAPYVGAAAMSDPRLELYVRQAGSDQLLLTIDNWGGSAVVATTAATVGAFALPDTASRDSVILTTLEPGIYSAKATSVNNANGIVLIEVYELP